MIAFWSPEDIRARLAPILLLKRLKLPKKRLHLRAVNTYALHPVLDLEVSSSLPYMETAGIREILCYDRDFDRTASTPRAEPG